MANLASPNFTGYSYAVTSRAALAPVTGPGDGNRTCQMDEAALRVPLIVFYSLFFVLGLAGNVLALYVFLNVHTKKNSVRVFLINVAVADLLLVACLPFRAHYHSQHNHWALGATFCKVVGNMFYVNMYVSITLLGLISIDRHVKIQRASARSRIQNSRWSVIVCTLIWAFAIASAIALISKSEGNEEAGKCFQYKQIKGSKGKAYFNFFMVGVFWLVFFCLIGCYGKIALSLLAASRDKPDLPNAHKYSRTAKKSFFVLFIFTVCFVPYHAFRIFYILTQIGDTSCYWQMVADKTNEVALLLSTFNSCLDPVMYFLLSGSVRKATLRILGDVLHLQDNTENSSTTEFPRSSQYLSTPRPSLSQITTLRVQPNSSSTLGLPQLTQD
ncbi:hypothetical protein COCON_G00200410 [Conger conger]|uniref:Probable G-protein coupled receptor 34 n=1 Tax=Conger conger TaxID=82655 RepID=A0A9Q1D272_CONCO|nr:probable G-protein coupled receptor 34 [Conger conger]XP_061081486.1 probable G-protein coupled receptor 34 [Conger conger]KAJ8256177.1 hypothetical protein COCON_G00200410 [Conger conger]